MWVTKQLMGHIDKNKIKNGSLTVWLQTFFKILFCVQQKKKKSHRFGTA